jgi:hypothetical protein
VFQNFPTGDASFQRKGRQRSGENARAENNAMTSPIRSRSLRTKYLGLEWKDFLSLSMAALALALSLWVSITQYVESSINQGKQQRQTLYIAMRIGKNLGDAYYHYTNYVKAEQPPP